MNVLKAGILGSFIFVGSPLIGATQVKVYEVTIASKAPKEYKGYDGQDKPIGTSLLLEILPKAKFTAIDATSSKVVSFKDSTGFDVWHEGRQTLKKNPDLNKKYGPGVNQFQQKRFRIHKNGKSFLIGFNTLGLPRKGARYLNLHAKVASIIPGKKVETLTLKKLKIKDGEQALAGKHEFKVGSVMYMSMGKKVETYIDLATTFQATKAVVTVDTAGKMFMGGAKLEPTKDGFKVRIPRDIREKVVELRLTGHPPVKKMIDVKAKISLGLSPSPGLSH